MLRVLGFFFMRVLFPTTNDVHFVIIRCAAVGPHIVTPKVQSN